MAAKIFISHSCKDFERHLVNPHDLKQEARWRRLQYARAVREKIVQGLENPPPNGLGYKVLLDRNRLEPGDEWRAKLHGWLGSCDGAVLLLSEDSIISEWVRKEVTILTWRKSLRHDLLLAPVFLGDLQVDALKTHGLECLQLGETQAVKLYPDDIALGGCKVEDLSDKDFEEHATCLAKKVLSTFQGLSAVNVDTEMEKWVHSVAARLQEAKPYFLNSARKELQILDDDWSDDEGYLTNHDLLGKTTLLAHQLLNAAPEKLRPALNAIRQGISKETFEWLVHRVACQWVDIRAAQKLLPAARPQKIQVSKCRFIHFKATYEETCRAYLNRAHCCELPNSRMMVLNKPQGEDFARELLKSIEKSLLNILMLPAIYQNLENRGRGNQQNLLKRRDFLIEQGLMQGPFYVVLDVDEESMTDKEVLENIRTARKNITFLLLSGKNFPTILSNNEDVENLEPELTEDKEDAGISLFANLLSLAD